MLLRDVNVVPSRTWFGFRIAASAGVLVTYNVTFVVSSPSDVQAQYNLLSAQLVAAVQSGNFTSALRTESQAFNATALSTAGSNTAPSVSSPIIVSSNTPMPTQPPSSKDGSLSTGAIVGIVLGVLGVLAVVGAGMYYWYAPSQSGDSDSRTARDHGNQGGSATAGTRTAPVVTIDNPAASQRRERSREQAEGSSVPVPITDNPTFGHRSSVANNGKRIVTESPAEIPSPTTNAKARTASFHPAIPAPRKSVYKGAESNSSPASGNNRRSSATSSQGASSDTATTADARKAAGLPASVLPNKLFAGNDVDII